jgi:D-3-phosphoglycerate dehydrogenase
VKDFMTTQSTTKILVADDLSARGIELLQATPGFSVDVKVGLKPDALQEIIGGYHGLAVRSATKVDSALLARATNLKVVGRAGIGVDNIDVPSASRRGIIVMNTPGGNAVTTAEHAICLLASLVRQIPQATASMKAGKWEKKKFAAGIELADKVLGVVGLGNIGRIVADRAIGLKMRVVAYDPFVTEEAAARLGVQLASLDDVLARADFVTIHVPFLNETKGLVNAAAIAKMKKGALLVNASRGGIVDEEALLAALTSGHLGGAALDVFSVEPPVGSPLPGLDNVICTPHLGASTEEAQEKVAIEVAEQLVAFFTRGEVRNAVNMAPVSVEAMPRMAPFLELAGRIGSLVGQLSPEGVNELEVEIGGEVGELGVAPIVRTALVGFLKTHLEPPVNEVNAPLLAKERSIHVVETKKSTGGDYTSWLAVRARGRGGERYVKGTVFAAAAAGPEPRLVQVDDFLLEAVPEGQIIVIRNDDRPGVIGSVGTLLGGRGINVSRMQVGLVRSRHEALMLWNVDAEEQSSSPVGEDILEAVRKLAHVKSAFRVSL